MKTLNFIHKNRSQEDKVLFFADNQGVLEDEFIEFDDTWLMAHIMFHAGVFPSISQARKNGWDKPIPDGFSRASDFIKNKRLLFLTQFWILK